MICGPANTIFHVGDLVVCTVRINVRVCDRVDWLAVPISIYFLRDAISACQGCCAGNTGGEHGSCGECLVHNDHCVTVLSVDDVWNCVRSHVGETKTDGLS